MGIFRNGLFPYSNYQNLNLDWILGEVQRLAAEWAQYHTEWDQWKDETDAAYQSLHDYVMNYFANLDVTDEISEKINQMALDGSLNAVIDPVIATSTAAWLAQHITPTSPAVDDTLTISGAAADSKVTGDYIRNLVKNNSFNFVEVDDTTGTSAGIDYIVKNNVIEASGVPAGRFLFNVLYMPTSLPEWLERGKNYYIALEGESTRPPLMEIFAYNGQGGYIYLYQNMGGGFFSYPEDVTYNGILIRITSTNGREINGKTFFGIYEALPNNKLNNMPNIEASVKRLNSYNVAPYIPNGNYVSSRLAININNENISVMGTSGAEKGQQNLYYNATELPEWLERGKAYNFQCSAEGTGAEGFAFEVFAIRSDASFINIARGLAGSFVYPTDTDFVGVHIRYRFNKNTTYNLRITQAVIYDIPTNLELYNLYESITREKEYTDDTVKLYNRDYNYYIRSKYTEDLDFVYYIQIPYQNYNYTFNFVAMKTIPADTPDDYNELTAAFQNAPVFKPCGDDIPALTINGNFLGANHGNPNYIRVNMLEVAVDETAIGSSWTDENNNNYILVQVFSNYLVFGSRGNNGELIYRTPETLSNSTFGTINPDSVEQIQLRRSAINKKYTIKNENGLNVATGGAGNNIIIIEDYDIQNQSEALTYLVANLGNNTNESYYSDEIPYIMVHVKNIYKFNRNASITVSVNIEVKEDITINRIYGGISGYFSASGTGYENYGYIPGSTNLNVITPISNDEYVAIRHAADYVPDRHYQYSSNNKAHFIHLLNGIGETDGDTRELLPVCGWFSSNADKLYTVIKENINAETGDAYSWTYARGPFQRNAANPVVTCFDLGNDYIIAIETTGSFDGYVKLPEYIGNRRTEIIESENITLMSSQTTTQGIKLSATGRGKIVIRAF